MKPPLQRTLSAVPRLPHVQLEIAKAIGVLMAPDEGRQLDRLPETAATASPSEQIGEIVGEALRSLRKAGFNPDEPRVPAGGSKGGQWTTSDDASGNAGIVFDKPPNDLWGQGPEYAANNSPGMGHNKPPFDEPPPIPPRPPTPPKAFNTFMKAAAYWLEAAAKGAAARYLRVLQAVYWITTLVLPYVRAYLSSPKTLKELQQDALNPQVGYDIHHVVEQTPARKEGFWTT